MNPYLESLFSIKDKVAVVTGGGRGLGRGMALALAGAGADLALVSRTESELEEVVREIEKGGGRAEAFPADLSRSGGIPDLVGSIRRSKGRIDILVNNAGGVVRKPASEFTPEEWQSQVDGSLKSAFFMARSAGNLMKAQGGGKIINIGSLTSFIGVQNISVYGIARGGGILAMTRALAVEWAKYHIHVNAIAPGYFRTRLTEPAFADEKRREWILSRIPWGRPGEPSDLAGAVVFLASSASDYVTGQMLVVDGGWLAG